MLLLLFLLLLPSILLFIIIILSKWEIINGSEAQPCSGGHRGVGGRPLLSGLVWKRNIFVIVVFLYVIRKFNRE